MSSSLSPSPRRSAAPPSVVPTPESSIERLRRALAAPLPRQATAEDRRRHAVLCVEAVLVSIEAGHVTLGQWESNAAVSAVSALGGGYNAMAVDYARRLLLPEGERPPRIRPISDIHVDIEWLRDAFSRSSN